MGWKIEKKKNGFCRENKKITPQEEEENWNERDLTTRARAGLTYNIIIIIIPLMLLFRPNNCRAGQGTQANKQLTS